MGENGQTKYDDTDPETVFNDYVVKLHFLKLDSKDSGEQPISKGE